MADSFQRKPGGVVVVQIVENWSDIEGEVKASHPSDVPGSVSIRILVTKVSSVEGFSNLLADAEGTTVEVNAPEDLASDRGVRAGVTIRCRVRRAGPKNIFLHPEQLVVSNA
ncbi:MAG TPA: hypothetical protein VFV34_10305 [Blastocatellia bacterium]|nr:hypothetical protein [Blastocatellia bacterium]